MAKNRNIEIVDFIHNLKGLEIDLADRAVKKLLADRKAELDKFVEGQMTLPGTEEDVA